MQRKCERRWKVTISCSQSPMEQSKISGKDQRLRTSTLTRERPERREEQQVLRGESDELDSPTPLQDDSTRDDAEAKNVHWSITRDFIYRDHVEPRVKLYMPRAESFPIPMRYIDGYQNNMYITWCNDGENYRMHERVSQDSFYWMKGHLTDIHGPARNWRGNKRPQDQTMYGQICGSICLMHRNAKQSKNGSSRNQSSIMPEDYMVTSSLSQTTKNSNVPWKTVRRKLEIPMPAAMPCRTQ